MVSKRYSDAIAEGRLETRRTDLRSHLGRLCKIGSTSPMGSFSMMWEVGGEGLA